MVSVLDQSDDDTLTKRKDFFNFGDGSSLGIEDYKNLVKLSPSLVACFTFKDGISAKLPAKQILDKVWQDSSGCIEANPAFAKNYGFSNANEVRGIPFSKFFPRSKTNENLLTKWVKSEFYVNTEEVEFNSKTDGQKIHSISIYSIVHDSTLKRIWVVSRDITDIKRSVRELQNAERHYKAIVERPGFALIRSRPDGTYLYISPHVEDIHGYKAQEFFKNPGLFKKLIHPEDIEKHEPIYEARRLLNTKPVEVEYRIRLRDGTYHWFYERQTAKTNDSGDVEFYDSIAFSIQDRKQLEATLYHSQKMEVVGTFAGGIAHDLNNHLTAILGQLTMALSEMDSNNSCYGKLSAAKQAALGCADMTKNLLSFGRKSDCEVKPLNGHKLVEETVRLLKHLLPSTIEVRLKQGTDASIINGNFAQLQQVLMNLGVNARDAMPDGGTLTIENRCINLERDTKDPRYPKAPPGEYTEFKVSDSGKGIPKSHLPYLFEPFFTTKKNGSGSGLGLSMACSIMEAHNGFLSVESEEGAGSCFSFIIPASVCGITEPVYLNEETTPRGSECILVADDDSMVLSMIKNALRVHGYSVIEASNGEEALETFRKRQAEIHLVLIDQTMPKISGQEVCQQISKLSPETPLILTSGYGFDESEDLLEKQSFSFIGKPYSLPDLFSLMRRHLDS